MRALTALMSIALLAGCDSVSVPSTRQHQVEALLRAELAPVTPKVLAMWYSSGEPSGIICGEIEAPPRLRGQQSRLRFEAMADTVILEPHLVAFDATGAQIAAESVAIFGNTWAKGCAPYAPPLRRIAGWFESSASSGDPDTPLTNAYVGEVLSRTRSR